MFTTIREVFSLLPQASKRQFIIFASLRVVINFLDLAALAGVGLIAAAMAGGTSEAVTVLNYEILRDGWTQGEAALLLTVVASLFIFKSILAAIVLRVTYRTFAGTETEMAVRVAIEIFGGDITRQKEVSRGNIHQSVAVSTFHAFNSIPASLVSLIGESTLLLFVSVVLFTVNFQIAAFTFLFLAVLTITFSFAISPRLSSAGRSITASSITLTNRIREFSELFREIHAYRVKPHFISEIKTARRQHSLNSARQVFLMAMPRIFVEVGLMSALLFVGLFGFFLMDERIDPEPLALFLLGGLRIAASLIPLQNTLNLLRASSPQAELALHWLNSAAPKGSEDGYVKTLEPQKRAIAEETQAAKVQFSHVWFTYPGDNEPTITDLSLTVAPGEFVALVGQSGSGKTTIADLTLGLLKPDHGLVTIDGTGSDHIHGGSPGVRVSYVPQHPGVALGTLAENVALGIDSSQIDQQRVLECLDQVGLSGLVQSLPSGIFSALGSSQTRVSGGQLQRIGLARALYREAALLVLDEPTNSQDTITEATISNVIESMRGSTTIIVIAHRLETIRNSDNVLVLENGRVIDSGKFDELKARIALFKNQFE